MSCAERLNHYPIVGEVNGIDDEENEANVDLSNKEVKLSPEFGFENLGGGRFGHKKRTGEMMELTGYEALRLRNGVEESLQESWSSLARVLDKEELEKWSRYYDDVKCYDDAWDTISMANAVILVDWQNKITDLDEYREGEPYAFICHSVKVIQDISKSQSMFKSCSLYTDKKAVPFNEPYGFIFSPYLIVAAGSEDLWAHNRVGSFSDVLSYSIPVIRSFDEVLEESGDYLLSSLYNEVVVLNDKKPEGIFYFDGQDKMGRDNRDMAMELQDENRGLRIVCLGRLEEDED